MNCKQKDIISQTNFSKDMSKKSTSSAARHSLTIRSKVTLNRILRITHNSLKIEINDQALLQVNIQELSYPL